MFKEYGLQGFLFAIWLFISVREEHILENRVWGIGGEGQNRKERDSEEKFAQAYQRVLVYQKKKEIYLSTANGA